MSRSRESDLTKVGHSLSVATLFATLIAPWTSARSDSVVIRPPRCPKNEQVEFHDSTTTSALSAIQLHRQIDPLREAFDAPFPSTFPKAIQVFRLQ
ncbi:MAG: hypothetical protein ACI87A_002339 [Planctomycetota bacterium]